MEGSESWGGTPPGIARPGPPEGRSGSRRQGRENRNAGGRLPGVGAGSGQGDPGAAGDHPAPGGTHCDPGATPVDLLDVLERDGRIARARGDRSIGRGGAPGATNPARRLTPGPPVQRSSGTSTGSRSSTTDIGSRS